MHAQTLKDAIRLTDNEQFDVASEVFKTLISNEPINGTNYYYMGENYLLSDDADSAKLFYEKGIAVDPNNPLNQIGQAKIILYNSGDKATVGSMIDNALIKAGPKNVQAMIEAADALIEFKTNDLDKATAILDKAYALDPKNIGVLLHYGNIYSILNNGTLAADYYNKALALDPKSVKAMVSKGRLYKRSTNYEGAAAEFENATKIDPSFAPAHRELAEAYYKLGKIELAKEEYRKFLELSKNNKKARIRYASFLYFTKDYKGTLNELNQLSKADSTNLTLIRLTTYSYYDTKDTLRALAAAQKLFSILTEEKATATDYEYYGKILALNNMDSLAVIQLRKAYEKDKARTDLLNEMWTSYDRMKKNSEAAAALQEKIQSGKGVKTADYFLMGQSYLYNNDLGKADSAFAKVNELTPQFMRGFLYRAKTNAMIDSTSERGLAKPFYEKYIELAYADTAAMSSGKYKNNLIEAYRYLASYSFIQLKDKEKAKEFLRKILELDSNDEPAKESLKNMDYKPPVKK
jgi:tetratricopeptide (TPR) repeat protein